MPDRIVRAGILTSDAVNGLSWAGEVFYRRLHSVIDDFGRYDGRAALLRAHLYPLKLEKVSESDVGKWLTECVTAGLVRLYRVQDRPYVEVLKFDQRARAKVSKWPQPPASDNTCQQPPANAPVFVSVSVDVSDPPQAAFVVPEWIPAETWAAYLAVRKTKRAGKDPHALGLIVKDLESFRAAGHDGIAILEASIKSCWVGVFEPKVAPAGKADASATTPLKPSALFVPPPPLTPEERAASDAARQLAMSAFKTNRKEAA